MMAIQEKAQRAHIRSVFFCGLSTLLLTGVLDGLDAPRKHLSSVPACQGITLSANYLSETAPGEGPGFQFTLKNNTSRTIRLEEPVPSSSHWYAHTQGRWLWRASNGEGGGLSDPMNERGRMIVFKVPPERISGTSFTVKPHQSRKWIESERENPVLEYKPGCPLCFYPGEYEYRVIFAYAYPPGERQDRNGLLACGIRSKPVPMPPKPRIEERAPAGH